jgi:Protein of unknown function (DUF664)
MAEAMVDEYGRPEPPYTGGEVATLLGFLDYQRATQSETHAIPADAWEGQARVSLRWVLVHMIEEYARHLGHADLIRESIDGRTGD